jgi:endonuclease/exonuclease/phosphatase family metal-dependent hydrolase
MLNIITWNVQWGVGADGRLDLARMVEQARSLADFDVLCLQEVADNFPDLKGSTGENQFAAIASLLPGFHPAEGAGVDVPTDNGARARFGNMILSRHPIGQILRHTLPWEAVKQRSMPRMLLETVLHLPSGPLRVMTTHLNYAADSLRRAEIEGIRDTHRLACARSRVVRENGKGPYRRPPFSASGVLTGDFNIRPEDPLKRRISEPYDDGSLAFRDAWEVLHENSPHPDSFCIYDRSSGQPHCCDYLFVTEDLAPRVAEVVYDQDRQASDHQPVLLRLDL